MKCPLCHDTGLLFAFTDQGVTPRCSCPGKNRSSEVQTPSSDERQQQAELTSGDESAAMQAQ